MEKIKLPKLTHEVSKEILEEHEKEMQRIALEEPKYIQFGFANGEVINVDIEDVHEMELSEISEKHYLSPGSKSIEKYKECTKVEITLLSFANKEDNDHFKTCYTFDRFISNNFIVDITYLNSNEDFLERIYVPWDYSSRDFNSYQKTRKNKLGQLEIVIGKDAQLADNDYKELLSSIRDLKMVSITSIQRIGYGYNAASKIYKELINKGFVDESGKVNKARICKEIGKEYISAPKFIFLDVDGVLNCKSTKDKVGVYRGIEDEKVALLKDIVDKTDAKIILISSWKEKWHALDAFKDRQDELANYLDEKLSKFLSFMKDKEMEYIFQNFVFQYYKREYKDYYVSAKELKWKTNDFSNPIYKYLPIMKTDIVISNKKRENPFNLIIDAKYYGEIMAKNSLYNSITYRSNHLYQLFSYISNFPNENNEITSGFLLYAKTTESLIPTGTICINNHFMGIETLDLNMPFNEIKRQLDSLLTKYIDLN